MSFSEPAIRSRNASRCGVRIAAMALLATLVILTGMGFTYQMVSREHDERRYQAPGELVDGGGFRMHLNALDEPTDGPTVILEQGDGSFSPQWGWV